MKVALKKALNAVGHPGVGNAVNAANFAFSVTQAGIDWYHNNKHHHSINLSDDEQTYLDQGGTIEFHYTCGNVLRAKKK